MSTANPCPERSCLQALLAGQLSEAEQEETIRHVEACAACQHVLDGLTPASQSWEDVALQLQKENPAPALRQVIEQAKASLLPSPSGRGVGGEGPDKTDADEKSTPHSDASKGQETLAEQRAPSRDEDLAFLGPSTRPDAIGRLANYEILEVIGKGGFGVVLKAFDEKLHRVVAIKVLSPAYAASGSARKRFIREARAAAAVKNEHVVAIYNVQDEAQPPYLVMELIDGISLQDKLDKQGSLGVKEILRISMQIAEGLAVAHKQGLVHRDIKPANILLENGVERVKITDFGLARAVDDASLTQSGTVAGTPMYMSPEQAEGFPIDHRSDLFSLGTVLYTMCTGHPPFRASGTHAVLKRVIDASPRPIREINNEIPDWLCDIIAKLHAKKPEERFQTAKEVAELLGQHLADVQQPNLVARPSRVDAPAQQVSDRIQSLRLVLNWFWSGAGLFLLLLAGAFAWLSHWDYAGLAFALWGLSVIVHRCLRPNWSLRLAWAAIFCAVLALGLAVAEFTGLTHFFYTPKYVIILEMDHPEIVVRIWTTEQTEESAYQDLLACSMPPNLKALPALEGEAAYVLQPVSTRIMGLPAGNYWVTAQLDGVEVHRVFIKIRADWFHVVYTKKTGDVVTQGDGGHIAYPQTVVIPGLANLLQREKNKLQGPWLAVAAEQDGKPMSKEFIERGAPRLVFAGDRLTQSQQMPQPRQTDHAYTLNPRKKPATLDIPDAFPGGKTMLAIYRWQGAALQICGSPRERPSDFTTAPGSERILFTLRRDDTEPSKTAEPGWVRLFNGKDLTGWVAPQPGRGDWHVDKLGHLVGKGDPRSYLFTQRDDYSDFHLRAELQVGGGSAGGICFRCGLNRLPFQLAPGYKASLTADPPPGSVLLTMPETKKAEFIAIASEIELKTSTWLAIEVVARGNRITVKLNGDTVVAFTDDKSAYQRGRIALETYLPGTQITFKKIEIKELPPEPRWLPKKAADIPRFVAGTWKIDSTIIAPKLPPAQAQMAGFNVFEPICGGKFLRGYSNYSNGKFESLMVQRYDEATDSVKGWFFSSSGDNHGPGVGRWNSETRTMLWLEKLPRGLQATYSFEFTDANTIKTRVYHTNDKSDVVFELEGRGTRLSGPVELKPAPIDPKRPAEMKIFDQFVGDWQTEGMIKTPTKKGLEPIKFTSQLKSRHTLGGRMIATEETGLPGIEDVYWLMTYDTNLPAYRLWMFNGAGDVISAGGLWDEQTGTLKWNEPRPDGSIAASTWKQINPDRWVWATVIKDAVGKTLFDVQATKTRKVSLKKASRETEEIPAKVREAVNKGLAYLAKTQHKDGHWEGKDGAHAIWFTALAGMTMRMEGSTLADANHADSLRRAVGHLLTCQADDGSFTVGGPAIGPMYTTACRLTILQLDRGAVPIYQR